MSAAPTGHSSEARTHCVVYLEAEEAKPVPFLAFDADDLQLYAREGEASIKHDCRIILGCLGSLFTYANFVKGQEIDGINTLRIGQQFLFVPAVPRSGSLGQLIHCQAVIKSCAQYGKIPSSPSMKHTEPLPPILAARAAAPILMFLAPEV